MFREGLVSDYFRVLQIVFPMQDPAAFQELSALETRDISRKWGGCRESVALGWSSAAELGWAPGTEGAHGKRAALQRDSSAQEQLLCRAQQGGEHCRQAPRGDE